MVAVWDWLAAKSKEFGAKSIKIEKIAVLPR
jgi:hypothetical protein